MKILMVIAVLACIYSSTLAQGKGFQSRETKNDTTIQVIDSITSKPRVDIVINMEMIESFRRCYDKMEVVDWASLFRGSSSEDLSAVYLAYKRMRTREDIDISTETLVSEVDKIKQEIRVDNSIKLGNNDSRNVLTSAVIDSKCQGSSSK